MASPPAPVTVPAGPPVAPPASAPPLPIPVELPSTAPWVPPADAVRGLSYLYRIDDRPSYSTLTLYLQPHQAVRAEAGAMVAMSANVDVQSQMQGGVMGALKRVVTHESLFVSTFTAVGGPAELLLAPSAPGDVTALDLRGQQLFVQGSAWLASDPNLTVDTKWGGFQGFVSGAGLFLISVSGSGSLFLSSFGAVHHRRLQPGERFVVDTGHIVAFESTVAYQLRKASSAGWIRSFTSGEGVVADFTGPGDLYLQTRNLSSLVDLLRPFFPQGGGGGLFGGGG